MNRAPENLFSHPHSQAEAVRRDPAGTLTLLKTPGIGSVLFRLLIRHFGSPSNILNASIRSLESVPGIGPQTAESLNRISSLNDGAEVVEQLQRCGARVVSIWDEEYPNKLKEIHDPPVILLVRGNLPPSDRPCLAIVGTRKPSNYGIRQARRLAGELAQQGIGIVSGMARGVDTAAHDGALQMEGYTCAVFGCGIDVIYPAENKEIAGRIESTGALISEFLPGTKPDPGLFPRRNRIISGLSNGVLVIEGDEKSGALITAKFATEQNREVFALPGLIDDRRSRGPHQLLRQGACLVRSSEDILEELGCFQGNWSETDQERSRPSLNAGEERIAQILGPEPIHIDKLVHQLQLPVQEILSDLLGLEMKGWVSQLPGKQFMLKRD